MAAQTNRSPTQKKSLTIEQRKERIAEMYRLKLRFEDWYLAANGKDQESIIKSRVLNGVIQYINNRIEYIATQLNPVIESPVKKRIEERSRAEASPLDGILPVTAPEKGVDPSGTDTKK